MEGRTYYVSEKYQKRYSDAHSYVENINGGQFMTCNIAYKKSVIESLGGFNENFVNAEDRDLAIRASKIGKIQFKSEMVVYHQRITRKPIRFHQMGQNKRIVDPLNFATVFFPPLFLSTLLFNFNSFKTIEDLKLLPDVYFNALFERLQIWRTCARERVFLI